MHWYIYVFFFGASIHVTAGVDAYSVHPSLNFCGRVFYRGATIYAVAWFDAFPCNPSLGCFGRGYITLTMVVVPAK